MRTSGADAQKSDDETVSAKRKEGASFEELEALTLGGLKKAVVEGDVKNGSLMAGQSAGLVTEKMTCEMLIRKLVKGTEKQIRGSVFYE